MSGIDLTEVANGALVSAVAAVGRWLATAARKPRGRQADNLSIARWSETYRLTGQIPDVRNLRSALQGRLQEMLSSDEVQLTLQELLAARLTDAPNAYATRAREAFILTFVAADPELAPYVEKLAEYCDDQICDLVAHLEGAEPSVLPQIRSEALSARLIAVLHAIERHVAALAAPAVSRTESAFLASYTRHVQDEHGMLQPPDFERRRLVPIREIYVPARIRERSYAERSVSASPGQAVQLNAPEFAGRIDRTVLLGDPGGGKTTTAKALMCHFNTYTHHVPFLVTLRDYAAADPPERSVVGHIDHELSAFYQCPAPPGLVDRLLLTGRGVVIFDGLDELLDTSRRTEVTARVERFCAEYPLAPVLVTSRLIGYDEARLDDRQFTGYRLDGFSDDGVRTYVQKWFAKTADFLHGRSFESADDAMDAAREFVAFCRGRMWVFTDAGTTARGETLYAFTHPTFLEYFAAAHLASGSDTPERLARTLAPRVARNEWTAVSELAVQIKDSVGADGARRVYLELLGEKRRRSAHGRSGVLQFLTRTLRSVDPTPAVVRQVTREILRFLFAGDTDAPYFGLPFAWLLASCGLHRSIVDQEVSAWIASWVESADTAQRLHGLRLAAFLDVPLWGNWNGEGPDLSPEDHRRVFWAERAGEREHLLSGDHRSGRMPRRNAGDGGIPRSHYRGAGHPDRRRPDPTAPSPSRKALRTGGF